MLENMETLKSLLQGVEYRVARSRQELEAAFHLVYHEYLKQGYINQDPSEMWLLLHNALPDTTTFVALIDEVVTATATVVMDSPLGLPMDELYQKELNELRAQGKRICEVSMLADSSELISDQAPMMLNAKKMFLVFFLFKHIFDYVRIKMDCDYICIVVNPKHANTYDSLLFQNLGEVKSYGKVNGAPAIAKYLDIHAVNGQKACDGRRGLHKMFLSGNVDPEKFESKFYFNPYDLRHFFVELKNVLKDAAPDQIAYIHSCYPGYNFSEILPRWA